MAKIDLTGTPRPHYLTEVEFVEACHRLINVTGKCFFPLSDVSIADRMDHVNFMHHEAVAWNIAHLYAREHNLKMYGKYLTVRAVNKTSPDKEISVEGFCVFNKEPKEPWGVNEYLREATFRLRFLDSEKGLTAELKVDFSYRSK